jgi:two-component system LytT family response regulator
MARCRNAGVGDAGAVTPAPIRALVVDDDAAARRHVGALLTVHDDIVVAGECADGRDAVSALKQSPIDLVFLDVEMPRLDGFGVLAEVGAESMPPVIFISAYTAYAVRAFEAYALDYLLKPFDDTRFRAALDRARPEVEARRGAQPLREHAAALDPRLTALLEHLNRPGPAHYPDALAIKTGEQYVVVRVGDIDWIEADGNYARVYIRGRGRLLTKTLAVLETEVLDPAIFVRVHRSAIVNASKIAGVEPRFHGELTLILGDGSRVPCSRRHRKRLEEKLYFTT